MHPFDTVPPEVRGPLIPVHTLSPQVLCDLLVMLLRPLGGDLLEPVDGFDVHPPDIGGAGITDPPALTLQEACDRLFRQLGRFQQGAAPLRELLATGGAP